MRVLRWCRIDKNGCPQCRNRTFQLRPVLDDRLAEAWELTPRLRAQFNLREGDACTKCRMPKRVRMLLWSIRRLFPEIEPIRILHLNQVNELSGFLKQSHHLVETFFDSSRVLGSEYDGLINQDMQQLQFETGQFDLVVHSETLEHLHRYYQALAECHRVLKPGGFQVYSVPLIRSRETRRRIQIDPMGNASNVLPESYHGLGRDYQVVWEFGKDFLKSREPHIFELHYDNYWLNPTIFTIIERKPGFA
jgi:SAM-dependent methyltransferase